MNNNRFFRADKRKRNPLNFTQIFPYINQFLAELNVSEDPSKIGLYSGLVESAFAFAQLLAIYPWASLSDRIGRKPVILAGVLGLTIATLCFGVSSSFPAILATRALAGIFSGNVSIIPTVLCDITDASNEAFAFSLFTIWWPIGSIVGPLIGGFASNPGVLPEKYRYRVFEEHRYFLPCILVAVINFGGFLLTYFFLQETVEEEGPDGRRSFASTTKLLLSIPIFRSICASAFSLSFLTVSFEVVFVLFCYSPVREGGLGLSIPQIGYSLGFAGFVGAISQFLVLPALLRRFNHAKIYYACVNVWPVVFLALPVLHIVAGWGYESLAGETRSPEYEALLWIGIASVLATSKVGIWPYLVNMLLVKNYTPTSVIGSANGLLQLFICISRAFGPIITSTMFSLSVSRQLLFGYMWAVFLSIFAVAGTLVALRIVKHSHRV
ncbi:MFS general substrate transporter [Marasmius fiardii PR-910]|nr:MFS general substrate transporter [Marasmius fiardii PR-910]